MGLEGATTPAGALNGFGSVSGPAVWGEIVDTTSASTHGAIGLEERVPAGPARSRSGRLARAASGKLLFHDVQPSANSSQPVADDGWRSRSTTTRMAWQVS